MLSEEPLRSLSLSDSDETGSSSRISFSSEFLDESNFITICPSPRAEREERWPGVDFEFLSGNLTSMIAADELFSEGKLLPFRPIHHTANGIRLKPDEALVRVEHGEKDREARMAWFLDEDPSPRPPKCTVLWKELLRLKKQRPSMLSPSNSSSSSSSSSSSRTSVAKVRGEAVGNNEKSSNKLKKGSFSIRIRPVLNVPICIQAKNAALPPLFSTRKGRS
ncbi:uncharacterized protein LOC125224355 [Salvia hispanica]|uniref:uncharacterized protein LOC125224355 n=1 Tax=Salvia hispanica TaxID=49212 RepID=UPI0020098ACB|nr:uncharacterized protein LOC125224355 [Salvia hispanica]XP_047983699.1 uncharacterized protein LOC125224355 [Salvia hispanica]